MVKKAKLTRRQRAMDLLSDYLIRHRFANVTTHPYGAACRENGERVWVELVIADKDGAPRIEPNEIECMMGYYDRIDVAVVRFLSEYTLQFRYYAHMDEILSIPMPPSQLTLDSERNTACQNLRAL